MGEDQGYSVAPPDHSTTGELSVARDELDAEDAGWTRLVFRSPPRHPDSRDVYLGGCGLITLLRGILFLRADPQGGIFEAAGSVFTDIWSWVWVLGGLFVIGVACTGHHWEELDRYAAFSLMMIWWVWAALYLISAGISHERQVADLATAVLSIVTGLVLTAGVIMGIRKTQEIHLRQIATGRIRELEEQYKELVAENERLRLDLGRCNGDG